MSLRLSVIIPTYNRRHTLSRTLPTLFDQSLSPTDYEVIVVVDGSRDGTVEYLRNLRAPCALVVLSEPVNHGQGNAENIGLTAARGEFVLLLDDDLLCDRNLLAAHLRAHASSPGLFVIGKVPVAAESRQTLLTELIAETHSHAAERFYQAQPGGWPGALFIGTNVSAPREQVLKAGGFDDQFTRMYESVDHGLRLLSLGLKLQFAPNARAHQIYEKSAKNYVHPECYWRGRNSILLARKHPGMRPYLPLSRLYEGSLPKRIMRRVFLHAPFSPDPALAFVYQFCELTKSNATARRAGITILKARMSAAVSRSALKELGSWQGLRQEFGMRLPALVYRHVGPERKQRHETALSVTPAEFERQILWLSRHGYSAIRPSDWHAWVFKGRPLPDKPVLIAFDGGYADVAKFALPVLERYGFSAAVYIVTQLIGKTSEWDSDLGSTPRPLMTTEQILYWQARGFEFGSNSRTHPDLTTLNDNKLEMEIVGSKDELSEILDRPIYSFAYPFNRFDDRVRVCARTTYLMSFGSLGGFNDLSCETDALRRIEVKPADRSLRFRFRVQFGLTARSQLHLVRTEPDGPLFETNSSGVGVGGADTGSSGLSE